MARTKNPTQKDVEQMLSKQDQNAPDVIRRYIIKYKQQAKGGPAARINTAEAQKWFNRRISKDTKLKANNVARQIKRKEGPLSQRLIGRMYLFNYNAKHKDTLPVWDAWPLVFFFNTFIGDGKYGEAGVHYLMGLNVHYLPPALRLILFKSLLKLNNDAYLRDKSRLKLSWRAIKAVANHKYAQHAVHMYRTDHVMSQLSEIQPRYWIIVLSMQIADWRNGGKSVAWKM